MTDVAALHPEIDRIRSRALLVGAVGLAVALLGALLSPREAAKGYLIGFLFWLGISLGSVAIPMLHHLTGGLWGYAIRRPLEAGAMTLPVMALLFVPLALAVRILYPWAAPDHFALSEAVRGSIRHKADYLNVGFFLGRAVAYFVIWVGFGYILCRWSRQQDKTEDPSPTARLRVVSGPGLGLFFLTTTFAMIDWVMSLEPAWYSTIFSAMMIVGQGMTTFALMLVVAGLLRRRGALEEVATPTALNDLGNLLLAFVMLWAYMSFSQFLIIWAGNLPEEIPWYLKRMRNGWEWLALFLIVFHFFLPFFVLLFREVKRDARIMTFVAAGLLAVHVLDLYWLVAPSVPPTLSYGYALDLVLGLAAWAGVGGIWTATFLRELRNKPLVPLHDPGLEAALAHHHEFEHQTAEQGAH